MSSRSDKIFKKRPLHTGVGKDFRPMWNGRQCPVCKQIKRPKEFPPRIKGVMTCWVCLKNMGDRVERENNEQGGGISTETTGRGES